MQTDLNKVFVVVPVYNESAIIDAVMGELLKHPYQVIAVDDGSEDDTFEKLSKYPVILIHHPLNLGQGAALQTGMEMARLLDAEIVVHFDADGQHSTSDIRKIIQPLIDGNCHIVFGSRFLHASGRREIPFLRAVLLRMARLVDWLFTGILLSDAHNGFRAMDRTALERIQVHENRMAHATEIVMQARKFRLKYKEVPVTISYTPYSRKKGQSPLNAIHIFFNLIFKKLSK
jgi:glycosyltransferase involved in cell wall biosynthesis